MVGNVITMNVPAVQILLAITEQAVLIKVQGKASFAISVDFKTAVQELRKRNHINFLIDLSECQLMDSTFLGVLAGLGIESGKKTSETECRPIKLVNPTQRVSDLLENLGVMHLFTIVRGPLPTGPTPELVPATPGSHSKVEVSRTCLEAHETLMALNPENIAKFKDVAKFLAEDVRRLESGSSPGTQPK